MLAQSEGLRHAEGLGAALISAYAEPHRHYHGLSHIAYLLREIAARKASLVDPGLVALAAWFHDAIYDPLAKDNEERCALWAEDVLPEHGGAVERAHAVAALVRKTAAHHAGEATGDEALFLDMDFSILGAPRAVYATYADNVRAEYGAVPEASFRAGRAAFLKGVLAQPRMFRTDIYERSYADAARANIAWEIARLSSGSVSAP